MVELKDGGCETKELCIVITGRIQTDWKTVRLTETDRAILMHDIAFWFNH